MEFETIERTCHSPKILEKTWQPLSGDRCIDVRHEDDAFFYMPPDQYYARINIFSNNFVGISGANKVLTLAHWDGHLEES